MVGAEKNPNFGEIESGREAAKIKTCSSPFLSCFSIFFIIFLFLLILIIFRFPLLVVTHTYSNHLKFQGKIKEDLIFL